MNKTQLTSLECNLKIHYSSNKTDKNTVYVYTDTSQGIHKWASCMNSENKNTVFEQFSYSLKNKLLRCLGGGLSEKSALLPKHESLNRDLQQPGKDSESVVSQNRRLLIKECID